MNENTIINYDEMKNIFRKILNNNNFKYKENDPKYNWGLRSNSLSINPRSCIRINYKTKI